jgi:hypothetical protein
MLINLEGTSPKPAKIVSHMLVSRVQGSPLLCERIPMVSLYFLNRQHLSRRLHEVLLDSMTRGKGVGPAHPSHEGSAKLRKRITDIAQVVQDLAIPERGSMSSGIERVQPNLLSSHRSISLFKFFYTYRTESAA